MAKKIKRSPTRAFGINRADPNAAAYAQSDKAWSDSLAGVIRAGKWEGSKAEQELPSKNFKDTSKPWWLRDKNPYEYYSGSRSSLLGEGWTPERVEKRRQQYANVQSALDTHSAPVTTSSRLKNMMGSSQGYGFPAQEGNILGTSAMTKKSGFTMKRGNRPNKHEFFKG